MKKLILSVLAVMTMSLSFAKPTEKRIKEVVFGYIDVIQENPGLMGSLHFALIGINADEIKSNFKVAFVDYYASENTYIAYISSEVDGREVRLILPFYKYKDKYYMSIKTPSSYSNKSAESSLAAKIKAWVYMPEWLNNLIDD